MTETPDIFGPPQTAVLEPAPKDRVLLRGLAGSETTSATRSPPARRLLLVAYQFPPVGGAGVQRVTKFVKYLPQFGWQSTVLTVKNPSVPAIDHSLLNDVPKETTLARAKTWEPSYALKSFVTGSAGRGVPSFVSRLKSSARQVLRSFANCLLQPDPQILWVPNAIRMGRDLLMNERYDAILSSAPPFSTFLVGRALSRQFGLPLIVDYRDEWDLANAYMENRKFGRLASFIQRCQQSRVLQTAQAIIATTRASTTNLEQVARRCGSSARAHCIFNGYDPDDIPCPTGVDVETHFDTPLRLVYVGTLWKLTSMAPLAAAIQKIAAHAPDLSRRLQLVVAGRRTGDEQDLLATLQSNTGCVEEIPYLEHSDAVTLMRTADLLVVNLSGLPGADRVLPAKVFEYLAVGRPILAIAPRGEMWELLSRHSNAALFDPSDGAGIAEFLETRLECRSSGITLPEATADLDGLDRVSQCRQLAAVLEQAASAAGKTA